MKLESGRVTIGRTITDGDCWLENNRSGGSIEGVGQYADNNAYD